MTIANFIDAPDPDNFVQVLASNRLFDDQLQHVVLTGRPALFGATKDHPNEVWNLESSQMIQRACAARIERFLDNYGISNVGVYDGGIAPRTLVPHWVHFAEYYKFGDVDPVQALQSSVLQPQETVIQQLGHDGFYAVVGGPMTGLKQIIERDPKVANNLLGVYAMFATWGDVDLMDLGGKPRGTCQFNAACDPFAAHAILEGLDCPIYLIPTECTRVDEIAFKTPGDFNAAIASVWKNDLLKSLYQIWYENAIEPRLAKNPNEKIFIHDVCSAFALYDQLTDCQSPIYDFVPVKVEVPHLAKDSERWGQVIMTQTEEETNVFCARKVNNPERYLQLLAHIAG